jgi:hypothetical protein
MITNVFNIVADMLSIMIESAKVDGQVERVIPHLIDRGLSILQYANDTILFMEHDLEKAKNLKLYFQLLSNFRVSKLTSIRVNCIVFMRPKIRLRSMPSYSDATWVSFQLDIWESKFTFGD